MTLSPLEIATLLAIAAIGHVMALVWIRAKKEDWPISRRTIYSIDIKDQQVRREFRNSLNQPVHAVFLLAFLLLGCFEAKTVVSFVATLALTAVLAEIWHYASHRAFHIPALHWIHVEHHRSLVNTPFTAMSFSLYEKIIFSIGLQGGLALIDRYFMSLNFFGIAAWYLAHLFINSLAHSNFEPRTGGRRGLLQSLMTTTTYHALHHSRYTGNYGLGTRILDRLFGTEWTDYDAVFDRVTTARRPLARLREKVGEDAAG